MEVSEYISALRREGDLLAAAASGVDLDADVPTCPGWRIRDLLRHIGGVHRWARTYVAECRTEPMNKEEEEGFMRAWPDDDALIPWFRAGHAELVETLETAGPDLRCWTFLKAPSPLAFWARRQTHETGIHRADAESSGSVITPFSPAVAADGIDELLSCFFTRPGGRLRANPPRTLQVHADDLGVDWFVVIRPDRVVVSAEGGDSDCQVRGAASDLYLLLWNRRTHEDLDVRGDRSLLTFWRESARIWWS